MWITVEEGGELNNTAVPFQDKEATTAAATPNENEGDVDVEPLPSYFQSPQQESALATDDPVTEETSVTPDLEDKVVPPQEVGPSIDQDKKKFFTPQQDART